jgi:hypothetical protein
VWYIAFTPVVPECNFLNSTNSISMMFQRSGVPLLWQALRDRESFNLAATAAQDKEKQL